MSAMNYLVFCTCGRAGLHPRPHPWRSQVEDHWQLLTHSPTLPIVSQGSLLLAPIFLPSLFYTPPTVVCHPCLSLSPLCVSLLTHAASQLMVPDSCYVQSEPSRADAERGAVQKQKGRGHWWRVDIGTTERSMGMISDAQLHISR